MKSRIIISILLALLMLSVLATPALAGKPARDTLYPTGYAEGNELTAKVVASVSATHLNTLKVTISIRGAMPNSEYAVIIADNTNPHNWQAYTVSTDSNGNARERGTTNSPVISYQDGDTVLFKVSLVRAGWNRLMWNTGLDVKF